MTNNSTTRTFTLDGQSHDCQVARPSGASETAPAVIVFHAWAGQDEFAVGQALLLAQHGYIGVAADLYGSGRRGSTNEECSALMAPLVNDRKLLARRIMATVECVRGLSGVDSKRIGAIGFCFGGLCAFDLARARVEGVVAAVGFHALFTPSGIPASGPITTKVLALHGYDDPMADPKAMLGFAEEMKLAGADWEIDAYGGTVHAFTNPAANNASFGTVYQRRADERSHARMLHFLRETFDCAR